METQMRNVAEWKKEKNITKVRKRKFDAGEKSNKEAKSHQKKKKPSEEKEITLDRLEDSDMPMGKFEKMVKGAKYILKNWIEGAMRPFWMSSAKPWKNTK